MQILETQCPTSHVCRQVGRLLPTRKEECSDKRVGLMRQTGNVYQEKTTHWEVGGDRKGSCPPFNCLSNGFLCCSRIVPLAIHKSWFH
ncbi:MAG: hypothetical protein HXN56_01695 [Prevotella nigrescens]|nr:hypothetical protein [Prevotella nigrescens]